MPPPFRKRVIPFPGAPDPNAVTSDPSTATPVARRTPALQPSNATAQYLASRQPVVQAQAGSADEDARRKAGVSEADWAKRKPENDPFKNGFFSPAGERQAQMDADHLNQQQAGRDAVAGVKQLQVARANVGLPLTRPTLPPPAAAPSTPVGGTVAVVPPVIPSGGVPASGFANMAKVPGFTPPAPAAAVAPVAAAPAVPGQPITAVTPPAGTRQPVIAGASGDMTSQFADRTDPTLDRNYIAGKDAAAIHGAYVGLPRQRKQMAVPQTSSNFYGAGVA